MARSDYDSIEDVAKSMDQRKPIIVDEQGRIHDADKVEQSPNTLPGGPVTQLKPTTWFGNIEQIWTDQS